MTTGGSLSGRHSRSPAPVHIASPSQSWISGRQSAATCRLVSLYQYIAVRGATPMRAMAPRAKSRASTSVTTVLPLSALIR